MSMRRGHTDGQAVSVNKPVTLLELLPSRVLKGETSVFMTQTDI